MSIDFGAVLLVCGGLLVGISLGSASTGAKEVANGVVNNTANRVTTIETEVYRVVCVESADGYCKEYSVRRITKE